MSENEKEKNKVKRIVDGNSQRIFVIRKKSSDCRPKAKKKEGIEPSMFSFSSLLAHTFEEDLRRDKEDLEKVVRISQERKNRES